MVKRLFKIQLLVLGLLALVLSARAQNADYINNHRIMAEVLSKTYGIPAPVILAIAAVESSGGAGPAARVLNNHFGIVGENHFVMPGGVKSRYKQYDNAIASYIDFCKLITRKRFYARLKNSRNCSAWIKAISNCGYSEAPEQWQQKVFSVLTGMEYSHSFAAN